MSSTTPEEDLNKVELEQKEFNFGGNKLQFLKVKDPRDLSQNKDNLWAVEWKSAFAFADFVFSKPSEVWKGIRILEIGKHII
jgi:hypothetical protein